MSFQFTDHYGRTYNSKEELRKAAASLEKDALFLAELSKKVTYKFSEVRILSNSQHAFAYAAELRSALA